MLRRREVVRSGVYTHLVTLTQCLQIITDLVMTVRILDKDITQVVDITKVVQIPRLSSRVLFLTREGRDGGMI